MDEEFARYLLALLPRFLGALPEPELAAFAARLVRVHLGSGEVLYRQGEAADCMHFVVTGRLEVWVRDARGDRNLVAHLASGDCVGELALLTGERRSADVIVARDTVLARLGRDDYDDVLRRYPEAGLNIARFALRNLRPGAAEFVPRVRNIALVPLDPDVPLAEFARRLEIALLRFGGTLYLDATIASRHRRAASRSSAAAAGADGMSVDRLLDQAESARRFVICAADAQMSEWTRKCVAHADRVLFVADAARFSPTTPIEQTLLDPKHGVALTQKELVLLHPNRRAAPSGTAAWLASRGGYRHCHVCWDGNRDFNRLARLLSGNAVTLVLGGGGARGLAQIGAVRAIREAGVPIDAVGGSSIGAIIGALVAFDWADEQILQSCKRAFVDDRPLDDFTVPVFSLLSGRKLARTLHHYVGDVDIADLWQPYFCVSSNLSKSRVNVHHSGKLWQAIRASASLPGLLPPVVADGDLYVDGGVLDNLPVRLMKRFVGGNVIAVESAVEVEYSVQAAAFPTPLEYLRSRLSGSAGTAVPTLPSLLIKSTVLGGKGGREELQEGVDLYLNPSMRHFGFLDWGAIYEIVDVGYRYTQERLLPWMEKNLRLPRGDELLEVPR